MASVPKAEWAIEKVRVYIPQSRLKSTLIAIAGYTNYQTGKARPSIASIAHDSGHSIPTVKRHIKQLEAQGHLVVDRESRNEHRPSYYTIPCCSLSIEELEYITGVDPKQLDLGLIAPETIGDMVLPLSSFSGVAERQWVSSRYLKGISMIPNGYQDDTLTLNDMVEQKDPAQILLEKGMGIKLKPKKKPKPIEAAKPPGQVSDPMAIMREADPEFFRAFMAHRERESAREASEQAKLVEKLKPTKSLSAALEQRGVKSIADLAPKALEQLLEEEVR